MTTIKIGNLNVPVIGNQDRSGNPGSGNVSTNVIDSLDLSNDAMFELGVVSGSVEAETDTGSPTISQNVIFTGGRTVLHDSSELVFDTPAPYGTATVQPQQSAGLVVHQEGTSEVSWWDASNLHVVSGSSGPGQTKSKRVIIDKLVAVSYKYPNADTENKKIKAYVILPIRQETFINKATGNVQITYGRGTAIYIPLGYLNGLYNTNMYITEDDKPEEPFDPSEPQDYDPNPDDTSDLIDIPSNPIIGVTGAGFINVYNPSMGSLQGLGDILFPNVASATDIVDAVIKLCETIANSNLINYVIDCHVIPVTPQIGTNANIKVGFRDTGISVPKVTNDYIDATCGSLSIPEYFHGFQDYATTRSKIYLPFIGFVDTKPEYWQAGTISVDYKFNVIDGSFMCYIRSVSSKSQLNGSVIAQYAGNACMHFPLTGVNYANMVSGLIGSAVAAASTGGASAVLGSALSAANTIAQGGDVQQSNGYNSTAALMGVRTPYLLIERPVAAYPAGYAHAKGYPSNIGTQLSNVTGFTIIEDIDLSGIPLTQGEIEELRGLLKEGVYF